MRAGVNRISLGRILANSATADRSYVAFFAMNIYDTHEGIRLRMNQQDIGHWNRWGPFVADRAWGTVREDYRADGDAWTYFPHDHAR